MKKTDSIIINGYEFIKCTAYFVTNGETENERRTFIFIHKLDDLFRDGDFIYSGSNGVLPDDEEDFYYNIINDDDCYFSSYSEDLKTVRFSDGTCIDDYVNY